MCYFNLFCFVKEIIEIFFFKSLLQHVTNTLLRRAFTIPKATNCSELLTSIRELSINTIYTLSVCGHVSLRRWRECFTIWYIFFNRSTDLKDFWVSKTIEPIGGLTWPKLVLIAYWIKESTFCIYKNNKEKDNEVIQLKENKYLSEPISGNKIFLIYAY